MITDVADVKPTVTGMEMKSINTPRLKNVYSNCLIKYKYITAFNIGRYLFNIGRYLSNNIFTVHLNL